MVKDVQQVPAERRIDRMDRARHLAMFSLVYCLGYFAYLWTFINFENEWLHWATLVALPAAGMWLIVGAPKDRAGLLQFAKRVGLATATIRRGIWWAVGIGLAMGTAQVALSRQRAEIWSYLVSGKFLYAFPAALLLMLVTAGFTEEFFFRGVVQTQLREWWKSKLAANAAASVLFGLYHLPYAYLKTSWPSHGDFEAAVMDGVVPSMVIGFILGAIYNRTRNLLAPVIVHASFNALWAMTMF